MGASKGALVVVTHSYCQNMISFKIETLFEPIKVSNSSEGDLNDFEKGFQASQVTRRSNSKVTATGSNSISS